MRDADLYTVQQRMTVGAEPNLDACFTGLFKCSVFIRASFFRCAGGILAMVFATFRMVLDRTFFVLVGIFYSRFTNFWNDGWVRWIRTNDNLRI